MPYPLPLTRTEAYLAYKAGVIQQSDLKPSLAVPRNGIDAWLAYWTGLANYYPIKNLGKNIIDYAGHLNAGSHDGLDVSLDDATGQITVSGQPTRGYAKIVNTYDITNLLEDGKEYTISQSAYDNKLYAQVNAIPPTGTPTYIYSTSSAKTFTVDKTTYPSYNLTIQTGAQSAWTEPQTITRTFQIEKGSSASAFEPYTGEPLILQEEEAYIAYLSGVINEYPEKCLRRVGAYLRYLISARWGRPDHPLNREELYLSLIKTQFIPSGDPSSDIEIDGTAKASFVDVKMYGNTFQQSYTGKNLLKFVPSTTGLNGLTVSYDEASGVVRVSGTPTQNWSNIDSTTKTMSLKAGSYILSVDNPSPLYRLNFRIYDPNASGGYYDFHGGEGGNYVRFTLESDVTDVIMRVYIDHNYGMTAVDWSFKIMLESGSDITLPYEPYVGGVPAPNPDYPQPIQTVTGEQTVEVAGKNMLNIDGFVAAGSYAGLTVQLVNKDESTGTIGLKLTGNVSAALWTIYAQTGNIQLKPNTDYILSRTFTESGGIRNAGGIRIKVGSSYTATTTDASAAFTTDSTGIVQILIYAAYNQQGPTSDIDSTVIFYNLLLEEGSTVTTFASYSKHAHEINLGKNLLEPVPATANTRGITTTVDSSTGEIIMQGESTQNYPWITNTTVDIPAGTYTFSIGNTLPYQMAVRFYYDETNHTDLNINAGGTSKTITLPNDTVRIVLLYNLGGSGVVVPATRLKLQLETGSTVTPYAPYFAPIELCKIGAYQDYIWKDGEDWKVHKATANITLNNTADASNWSKSNSTANNVYINQNIPNLVKDSPIVATNLTTYPTADIYSRDIVGICYNTTGAGLASIRIGVGLSGASTINLFKSWLESNPVTAYYALATPTDNIITNQTLVNQLEALVNGGAEEGTTYIKVSATDPNLPGLLYVEAPKYE